MTIDTMKISGDKKKKNRWQYILSVFMIRCAQFMNLHSVIIATTEHGIPTVCVLWKGWWWDKDGREKRHQYNQEWVENQLHTTYKDI